MNIFLLTTSTAIEFVAIWWFITWEFRSPASLRRFASWLVMIAFLFFSPFLQISMMRQIVAQRETADTLAHIWIIVVNLCELVFIFTLLCKAEKNRGPN